MLIRRYRRIHDVGAMYGRLGREVVRGWSPAQTVGMSRISATRKPKGPPYGHVQSANGYIRLQTTSTSPGHRHLRVIAAENVGPQLRDEAVEHGTPKRSGHVSRRVKTSSDLASLKHKFRADLDIIRAVWGIRSTLFRLN